MSGPIELLLERGQAIAVSENNLSEFLQSHDHSVLFFAGNPAQFPESTDLAIILPELSKAYPDAFTVGLVTLQANAVLAKQFAVTHWPSLVFHRGRNYLGCISQLQNWSEYCEGFAKLLQGPIKAPPAQDLPVLSTNSTPA